MWKRVVIDTNIIVSGLCFGGYPSLIVKAANDRRIEAIATSKMLAEYRKAIERMRAESSHYPSKDVLQSLIESLEEVDVRSEIRICRDPKDNMFLECAVDGRVSFIITGDDDLLALGSYEGIEIIRAHDFYDRFLAGDKPKEA